MSRAAATILGGMISGLSENGHRISFFAAVPVMIAATFFELYKSYKYLRCGKLAAMIALGFVVSFIFAWLAVKFFIHFLSRHTLTPFAWYRLILAGLVICFLAAKCRRLIGLTWIRDSSRQASPRLDRGEDRGRSGQRMASGRRFECPGRKNSCPDFGRRTKGACSTCASPKKRTY